MSKNIKGTIYAMLAAFFWSTQVLFTRWLNAAGLYAMGISVVRLVVACFALGGYLLCFKRDKFKVKPRDIWVFLCSGLICVFWFGIFYFAALERINIPTASVLISLTPIYVTINSVIFFKERITRNKLWALGLSMAGCVLVSGVITGFHGSASGVLLALAAGFVYSYYSIFSRMAINLGYESWTIVFYSFFFALIGNSLIADWGEIGAVLLSAKHAWLLYLGLGLFTGFFSYVTYSKALECMEPSRVSMVATSESVFCVLIGIFFFDEWPDLLGFAGILLVLVALYVLNLPEKKAGGEDGQAQ